MSDQNTSPAPKHLDTAVLVEIGLCVVLFVVFGLMFTHSYEWEMEAGLFPRMISGFGMLAVLAYLAQIIWQNTKGRVGPARRILDIPCRFISIARWSFTVTSRSGSRRSRRACALRSSSVFTTGWRKPPGMTRCSLI